MNRYQSDDERFARAVMRPVAGLFVSSILIGAQPTFAQLLHHSSDFGAQTEISGGIYGAGLGCSDSTQYGPRRIGTDGSISATDTETIYLGGAQQTSTGFADASSAIVEGTATSIPGTCRDEGDVTASGRAYEFFYNIFTVISDTLPTGTPVPEWGSPGDTGVILGWSLSGTFSPRTPGVNLGTTQFGIVFIQPAVAPLIDGVTVVSSQAEQFDLSDAVDIGRQFRSQFFRDLRVGDTFMVETRMYVTADSGICGGMVCPMSASFSAGISAISVNPDIQLARADGR